MIPWSRSRRCEGAWGPVVAISRRSAALILVTGITLDGLTLRRDSIRANVGCPLAAMPAPYLLYATECSLFSGKARAYLRYKRVPFEERLSTLRAYREVIRPRTGKAMIPVLITPDDIVVQDTTDIIDFIEQRFKERSVYPSTPLQRLVSLLVEVYADEWLVMPAMHYRWHFKRHNLLFVLGEFGGTGVPWLPKFLRPLVGVPPALVFGGAYKQVFGITARNEPVIERWTEALFAELDAHFAEHDFLLGGRPSVGDYGLMGPMYAHLYRDPYSGRLMKKVAPNLARWVERMNDPTTKYGDFIADDAIPATLDPVLRRMFEQQVPVLMDTVDLVHRWAADHPGRRVSRFIGTHRYSMDGVEAERRVMPYGQWMWQRPALFFQGLPSEEQERIAARLGAGGVGGVDSLRREIPTVLARVDNRLFVAKSPRDGRTGHPEGAPAQPHALGGL